jgi:hypothetical protein
LLRQGFRYADIFDQEADPLIGLKGGADGFPVSEDRDDMTESNPNHCFAAIQSNREFIIERTPGTGPLIKALKLGTCGPKTFHSALKTLELGQRPPNYKAVLVLPQRLYSPGCVINQSCRTFC